MNAWESVFTQSPVNSRRYYALDDLPCHNWKWPKGTWFQARLDYVREHAPVWSVKSSRKARGHREMRAM
ncbi:MAG: hypothetical protein FJ145_02450 [Deltaproteobacteria bacterium]|nr:hypothetical protein [Deltaproteobacteria bacterium]